MSKFKLCPRCETNYIAVNEELCELCKRDLIKSPLTDKRDENKLLVEKDLIPLLKSLDESVIESFTKKEDSFELFGLRLPLLIKCKDESIDECRKEIKDSKGHNRYYIDKYTLCGKKYHICSQWWSAYGNDSKDILKILNRLKNN